MNCDRARLSSTQLFQLATQGATKLTQNEKDRLSTDHLFVLAITSKLALNQHDKNRLSPLHVAHLAVTEKIHLSKKDRDRLPSDLLFEVFVEGFAVLNQEETARFTSEQLQFLKETINSTEQLSAV